MRDSQFIGMLNNPIAWFNYREFTVSDWVKDIKYLKIIKEALHNGQVPFHVSGYFDGVGEGFEKNRFFAWSAHRSPQLLFLYFVKPITYFVLNLLLMYSIGFLGCLLIRKHYHLGLLPFTFLFLIFNFNGNFVEKVSAYGVHQLGYYFMPYWVFLLLKAGEVKPSESQYLIRLGIFLGLIMTAIWFQNSFHIHAECVTFVLIWAIVNYKRWKMPLMSLVVTFTTGSVILFPAAASIGLGNLPRQMWGGYNPRTFEESLVSLHTIIDVPIFTWWEYSLYISLIGVMFLVYFGIWGP